MTKSAQSLAKSKQKKDARDIRAEALKIANSIKNENQTPAETKAVANGIQRGITIFLSQQSEKTRDLDKRTKKVKQLANQLAQPKIDNGGKEIVIIQKQSPLPWILLAVTWVLFLAVEVIRLIR